MEIHLQAILLFSLAVGGVWSVGIAPDDFDPSCRTGMNAPLHDFPEEWNVIMDTYNYPNLYDQFGFPSPVWKNIDFDLQGGQWDQVIGGTCTWQLFTCTHFFGTPQNNWLFSQFIRYEDAQEIFLEFTYRLTSCIDSPSCQHPYVTLYRYDVDEPMDELDRIDRSNYALLTGDLEGSRLQQPEGVISGVDLVLSIPRPANPAITGFYLGFQDEGTCAQVDRVITYYTGCPERQKELVVYPKVGTPPVGGPDQIFYASCVSNAHATTSLQVTAFSGNATCRDVAENGAKCECDGGYEIEPIERKSCKQCEAGTYRAINESSTCLPCPSNTVLDAEGAQICECADGYFRATGEGPDQPCTMPPPQPVTILEVEAGSDCINVTWQKPSVTGREDFYYEIIVEDTLGTMSPVQDILFNSGSNVSYSAKDLKSVTQYCITIIIHNGVSNQQDSSQAAQRTVEVKQTTTEGMPGVPAVTTLCTVVIWSPPVENSGVIVAYEARFEESNSNIITLDAAANFFITEDEQRAQNVVVEMRAKNALLAGPWSAPVTLNCTSQVNCPSLATTAPPSPTTAAPPSPTTAAPPSPTTAAPPSPTTSATPSATPGLCQPPQFMLKGIEYANGSKLELEMIETDEDGDDEDNGNALLVRTKFADCCREDRIGECYYPNGTVVGIANDNQPFYRNRGNQLIRLNRRSEPNFVHMTGFYRCELPDSCGTMTSVYIDLV